MLRIGSFLRLNPWWLTAVLLVCCLPLLVWGHWRSSSSAAQVQVPMFYDAHYIYPRPWTQAQSAPGIPAPFPLALYGANQIRQPFRSGASAVQMVEVWLAGPANTAVDLTLWQADGPTYHGQLRLDGGDGRFYRVRVPSIPSAHGRLFELRLAAPTASAEQPVLTHAVGGDRLGGPLYLNEYPHPANLQLRTYVGGTAVVDALTEQLLPDLFRLRLQQYKPLKGEWVAGLLLGLMALTTLFLVVAWPGRPRPSYSLGWLLFGGLLLFLGWQLADGRVRLAGTEPLLTACACPLPSLADDQPRIVTSLLPILWTAQRQPEERFIGTAVQAGHGVLTVPADSQVAYALTVPPHGRLQTTAHLVGEGEMRFAVWFGGQQLAEQLLSTGARSFAFDLDLADLAGQSGELRLTTEALSGDAAGLWAQPEVVAPRRWLLPHLPATAVAAGHRLGDAVQLLGYTLHSPADGLLALTLYWQTAQPITEQATVFVHLLDEAGQLLGQSDAMPVQNSYPLTVWPNQTIVADTHYLPAPEQPFTVAVGLYNSASNGRWQVINPDGSSDPDGRVLLPPYEP